LGGGKLCDQTAQISLSSCLIFVVPRRRAEAPASQSRARPPDPTHQALDNFESTLQISTLRFHTGVLFPPSFYYYFLSSPARTDFPISGISDVFPFSDVQMFPPQFSRGPPSPRSRGWVRLRRSGGPTPPCALSTSRTGATRQRSLKPSTFFWVQIIVE